MRFVAATLLGMGSIIFGSAVATAAGSLPALRVAPPTALHLTQVEFYCSEGFAPTSGGRCVATEARDEIELYLNDPSVVDGNPMPPHRHRRHHRATTLHERY